ncbi:MAG: DegT/DnrJ/EryC1/StrS family aminotransferase [Candidatus Binatia bacterium]
MTKPLRQSTEVREPEVLCPFHRPWLGLEEEREVLDTLRSGWLTTGPRTREFERRIADYVGCKHAVGLNSCTAGLHVGLVSLGVGPGDEVITTPITFAASANVIIHQGAKPVFVDVDPETLNIDASLIEDSISERTKAILPVHLFGHPCDMETLLRCAQRHHIPIIEDAAHAIGAEVRGKKVGTIGDLTSFSFYPTKNITTAEGGMITTNRDDLAEKIRILSYHGITASTWQRHGEDSYVHWDVIHPGYKYNMFDIQAALGIHQIKRIEEFWRRRRSLVKIYNDAFKEVPEIQILSEKENVKSAHHLYVVIVKTEMLNISRDDVLQALRNAGIGVGVHFRALHLMSFYSKTFGFKPGDLPKAEYASDRVISLPLYPKMEEKDARLVIKTVKEIFHRAARSKVF